MDKMVRRGKYWKDMRDMKQVESAHTKLYDEKKQDEGRRWTVNELKELEQLCRDI